MLGGRPCAAVWVSLGLIASACSSSPGTRATTPTTTEGTNTTVPSTTPDTSTTPTTAAPTTVPVAVPGPPDARKVQSGDPATQAGALAGATAPDSPGVEATWLTVFDMAGIPVFGPDGATLGDTGDDPLGPNWWELWLVAGARPDKGERLGDLMKVVVSPDDHVVTDEQADDAARAFIADLQASAATGDPASVFIATFVDAKARQAGTPVSLFDPALDMTTTSIDPATTFFTGWVALRAVALALGHDEVLASGLVHRPADTLRAAPGATPCNQTWGSEQVTTVTNWVIGKIGGGVELPGIKIRGLLERVGVLNPHIISADRVERFNRFASRLSALTSIASALMLYSAMDIAGSADTLDRTRTRTDGNRVSIRFDISLDPQSMPDGNDRVMCALSALLNAAGVTLNLPAAGPLAGVEVVLTGGDGFGERVLFADMNQLKQDTNPEGSINVDVIGKGQRRDIAASSPRIDKEYTIKVEATPEPIDGNSLFNTLFDSLSFAAAPNAPAAVSVILDILKTTHWDLGDHVFPMKDWISGWYIDQAFGNGHILGNHCADIPGQWTVTGVYDFAGSKGDQTWVVTINPDGATGTFQYADTATMQQGPVVVYVTGEAAGEASLIIDADGTARMHLRETGHTFRATTNKGGTGRDQNAPLAAHDLIWQVDSRC